MASRINISIVHEAEIKKRDAEKKLQEGTKAVDSYPVDILTTVPGDYR
jgi:hypothetical protein